MIMRLTSLAVAVAILMSAGPAVSVVVAAGQDVPRMSKEQANAMPSTDLVILDVRKASDWDKSDSKILGAVREDPSDVKAWAPKYPKDKTLLFYCN